MSINVITGPAAEPLTLAQAKLHLRVIGDAEDEYITSLMKAARQTVEIETSRILVTQTLRQTFDGFPADAKRFSPLVLLRQPVQSIVSVDYVDAGGQTVTLPSERLFPRYATPACVDVVPLGTWPTDALRRSDSVGVTYVAGFGGPADVPELAKAAIRLLLGHWYENREEVVTGTITAALPRAAASIMGLLSWGHYQ